jgi:carboxymethylenebutenolidase
MPVTVVRPVPSDLRRRARLGDVSETRTETVPLVDGSALRLTVAEPVGPARGGIVVLHEARGMTDAVRGMVEGLAAEGWLTVAPHLYHRDDADEIGEDDSDRVRDQIGRLESAEVMADTDTAFGWLAEHQISADRMGVLGFDVGAAVALLVAAERRLGAAVSVADEASMASVRDRLPPLSGTLEALTCPWLGLYGRAGDDDAATARLRDTGADADSVTNVVVYPRSGHRFDADPGAAADAWQRTLDWFDAHLR